MSGCWVCDSLNENENIRGGVYYFDPDFLTKGTYTEFYCTHSTSDEYSSIYFSSDLGFDGQIWVYGINSGYLGPGEHKPGSYTTTLKEIYDRDKRFGVHTCTYGTSSDYFTIKTVRVFLFNDFNSNKEANDYAEYEKDGISLSAGGYKHLIVKAGGSVSNLTIADSIDDDKYCWADFYSGANLKNADIGKYSAIFMENGSAITDSISITGTLVVEGIVDATGARIALNVKDYSSPDENPYWFVKGMSNLSGAESFSISVKSNQEIGSYCLANGFYTSSISSGTALEAISLEVGGNSGQNSFAWDTKQAKYSEIYCNGYKYELTTKNNNLYLNITKEIPDQVLEMLARNSSEAYSIYKDQQEGAHYTITYDKTEYYFVVSKVAYDDTGFYAMGLERTDESFQKPLNQAVVVCRGTDLSAVFSDWKDDFNPEGVGLNQYNGKAAAVIRSWLGNHSSETGGWPSVYFTGHSLGGALAQRLAVDYNYTANLLGMRIGGVVTFNSPGINSSKGISAEKVHHYIVDGDLISMVGNGYVYGDANSDSWYTVYQGNNVFTGTPTKYLYNRHTETLTCSSIEVAHERGYISELSSHLFSYIGTPDNFNANYASYILSLATAYGEACNTVICSSRNRNGFLIKADLQTANLLTTRGKAEVFRSQGNFLGFLWVSLQGLYEWIPSRPESKGNSIFLTGIKLGERNLVSSDVSKSNHIIRTLEYSGDSDEVPDLLYDFELDEFVGIEDVGVTTYYFSKQSDDVSQIVYHISSGIVSNGAWKYFALPLEETARLSLTAVSRGANGDQGLVSSENLIQMEGRTYVFDDSKLTDYWVTFSVNEDITREKAAILPIATNITHSSSEVDLIMSDIDSSRHSGGGNDEITVTVENSGGGASTTVKLTETEVDGIFKGKLEIGGKNGFVVNPGEDLVLSYFDNNDGNGKKQTVTTEIPVLQTDVGIVIDETGLDAEYEAISEDTAWYKFNLLVDSNTLSGQYVLAENLGNAPGSCVVWGNDSETSEVLAAGSSVTIDANTYTKQVVDDKLILNVKTAPRTISWEEFDEDDDEYKIEISQDNFETSLSLWWTDQLSFDLLNLPNGVYQYRITNYDEWLDGNWLLNGGIQVKNNVKSEQRIAISDSCDDYFFTAKRGVWSRSYQACHAEFGMTVKLEGKNKITDLFIGSDDTSTLLLTDDANGDALFLDDIYSLFPDGLEAQARIAKIGAIRSGAGDDLIDLTSQQFEYIGDGMVVYGGLGDDVIWANKGNNLLFGDAGNDCIVGAGGNDTIVGGAGDDTLHGGGGNDLFVFGGNWGKDTVEQLASGKVTLWFKEGDDSKWNNQTLTYTDGGNSVTVSGVSSVSLKFGNEDAQYSFLLAVGAFDEFTSEKIFEDRNKGLLA